MCLRTATSRSIAALDIGSSKVSALIVTRDPDGRLRVLGTGQRESRGVKRGYITDMEASEFAVREAVELAERMSGVTIDDVWASYGAGGLVSDVANVEVELGGHQIEQSDINELLTAGAQGDRPRRARSCSTPIRRSTRSTGSRGSSSRSGSTPTGSASTSMSSPPTRRRLRNIDYVIRSAHLGVKGDRRLAGRGRARLPDRGGARARRGAGRAWRRGHQRLAPRRRNAGRAALDPARRQGHHRRHRLRLRGQAARRRADQMLLRLGDDVPARQSRDDRGDADRRRGRRRADPHHPRPVDDGDPPAGRGTDRADRRRA